MGGVETTNELAAGGAAVLDPRVLEILEVNVGSEMVARLVALFRETAAQRLPLLADACAARDHTALRRVAHDWVSDASALGARELSETARRIERGALDGDAGIFDAARELETLVRAANAALAEYIGDAA